VPKKQILVVEDEGIVAKDIQGRLGAMGFDAARWVTTGRDAIAAVCDAPPDLVLMDIRLRGDMDGIQAARTIQAEHEVPVVYLTAHADTASLDRAMETEPFGYVLKPFQDRELQSAIEIALFKHGSEQTLRRKEEALRQINAELVGEKAFLAALFAAMPSPVLVVGADGQVHAVNARVDEGSDPLARPQGNVLPGDLLRCLDALDNPGGCGALEPCGRCQVHSTIKDALDGRRVHRRRTELTKRGPDGTARGGVVLISATPLDYGGVKMAVVVVEDVTELEGLRRLVGDPGTLAGIVGGQG
jgi:two-component system, response regulator PdtaR